MTPPGLPGLTVVAFYGEKPDDLTFLLCELQQLARRHCGNRLRLRPLHDVHATILGIVDPQSSDTPPLVVLHEATQSSLNVAGYLESVRRRLDTEQHEFRVGKYRPGADYGLQSRGQPLWDRSFVVNDTQIVAIGWPWCSGTVCTMLDEMRRDAERFGLRHKYHRAVGDVDPDGYMVIGDLTDKLSPREATRLEDAGRDFLAEHSARLSFRADSVWVVRYYDNRLPQATSEAANLLTIT